MQKHPNHNWRNLLLCTIGLLLILGVLPAQSQDQRAEAPASEHSSDALLRLGDYYSDGDLVAPDYERAMQFYRQAADEGRNWGKFRIAEMLLEGQGTPADPEGGVSLLEQLADENYPAALLALARIHLDGRTPLVEADPAGALDYLRRAAATDDPVAHLTLGDVLLDQVDVPANLDEVVAHYRAAWRLGNTDALVRMGDLLSDGETVAVHLEEALRYYQAAAAAGSGTAKLRAAEMLARGHGVTQDATAGLSQVRQLIEEGSASAMLTLSELILSGDVGQVTPTEAITMLERAAQNGRPDALLRLGEVYLNGTMVPVNRTKAASMLEEAAASGNAYALYVLGRAYTEGSLGRAKAEQGHALMQKALESGVNAAIVGIANTYLYGYGRPRDVEAALTILTDAMLEGNLAAGEQLISIYRDGRRDGPANLVRRNEAKARGFLNKIGEQLNREEYLVQALLLEAVFSHQEAPEAILVEAMELSPDGTSELLRELLNAAPNVYVNVVQRKLAEIGLYGGRNSGMLDRATIVSILQYCSTKAVRDQCAKGPLTSRTAQILSHTFH